MKRTDAAVATHAEVWIGGAAMGSRPDAVSASAAALQAVFGRLHRVRTLTVLLQGSIFGAECAHLLQRITERLPALEAIAICFTAASIPRDVASVIEVHQACTEKRVRFSADFVLDGGADACAALGGQPTSLARILEQSKALRDQGVPVRWWVPLIPALVYRLETLYSLARDDRIDPVIVPARWMSSVRDDRPQRLNPNERLFAWDFVTYRLLEVERPHLSPDRIASYSALQATLGSSGPDRPNPVHRVAVVRPAATDAAGAWTVLEEERPGVGILPGDGGPIRTGAMAHARLSRAAAQAVDVCGVLFEGVRGGLEWLRAKAARPARVTGESDAVRRFPTVLMIGAYGGDHIGDTAICGGVLLRMHQRYGTTRAVLMSQRPAHTRHLVRMLDTPVEVTVEEYRQSRVRALLEQVDAVVFAGGPLMDLPKQLVKHFYTVSLARRRHKPFLVEGIGAGPFVRRASAWTARRLVLMADRITLRTSADRAAPLMRDLKPDVGRDPAFDYLETRRPELTRCPELDRRWIERLLQDTAGRRTVGLNIRPIRPDYTSGARAGKRVEYTRFVEGRFEERLAEALRRVHQASAVPPCFVFFPMNAIQFGKSDLRSAYRIKRRLRGDVDFRIWEGDATIDGIVGLLRKLDLVVTMRFHATIFALALHRPVVGIDYRVGKSDKVAALLSDAGRSDDCARIDEMTSEWLFRRLAASDPLE